MAKKRETRSVRLSAHEISWIRADVNLSLSLVGEELKGDEEILKGMEEEAKEQPQLRDVIAGSKLFMKDGQTKRFWADLYLTSFHSYLGFGKPDDVEVVPGTKDAMEWEYGILAIVWTLTIGSSNFSIGALPERHWLRRAILTRLTELARIYTSVKGDKKKISRRGLVVEAELLFQRLRRFGS